jgi:hypothetical protein
MLSSSVNYPAFTFCGVAWAAFENSSVYETIRQRSDHTDGGKFSNSSNLTSRNLDNSATDIKPPVSTGNHPTDQHGRPMGFNDAAGHGKHKSNNSSNLAGGFGVQNGNGRSTDAALGAADNGIGYQKNQSSEVSGNFS